LTGVVDHLERTWISGPPGALLVLGRDATFAFLTHRFLVSLFGEEALRLGMKDDRYYYTLPRLLALGAMMGLVIRFD
jgi:hypothetical protein